MRPRKKLGNKNCVGATITRLRKERGWKQNELMVKMQVWGIDIGKSSISDLEGQNREIRSAELKALAEIFGVTIDQLYNKEEQQ